MMNRAFRGRIRRTHQRFPAVLILTASRTLAAGLAVGLALSTPAFCQDLAAVGTTHLATTATQLSHPPQLPTLVPTSPILLFAASAIDDLPPLTETVTSIDDLETTGTGGIGGEPPPLADFQNTLPPAESVWKASFALGASVTMGNTRRRAANSNADAERREGKHRTSARATWNYSQQKDTNPTTTTGRYELQQRRTSGSLKEDYFIGEKKFLFIGADALGDYDRNLALQLIATVGYGVQLIDEKDLSFAIDVGVGYYTEQSRNTPPSGVKAVEYATAKLQTTLDWKINEQWHLLNTSSYVPSLEGKDDLFVSSDTRLRSTLSEDMFAQLQWILNYDNTPLADVLGNPNNRMDHQLFLSIGWTF